MKKRFTEKDFTPEAIPLYEPARQVMKCKECGQIQAHDFIPFSLGRGVSLNDCLCKISGGSNWKHTVIKEYGAEHYRP